MGERTTMRQYRLIFFVLQPAINPLPRIRVCRDMEIEARFLQLANAPLSIVFTPAGRTMERSDVQELKAFAPMVIRELGKLMS